MLLKLIKKTILLLILALSTIVQGLTACQKYLEAKPDKKMVIISQLKDLQAIMDMYDRVNIGYGAGEHASDNYYVTPADYMAQSEFDQNMYKWNDSRVIQTGISSNAWSIFYDNVYRANTVLYNLTKIESDGADQVQRNNIMGQAFFIRARSFLSAVSLWSLAYDRQTASTDLGIPLRLNPDFNETSSRSNVQQTYEQIIRDLKSAVDLLPESPISVTRASKPAACALLARTYLYMQEYDSCYKYSGISLSIKNGLYDFNNLDSSNQYPFSSVPFSTNQEILFYSILLTPGMLQSPIAKVDSSLYQSYESNDLRKAIFFRNVGNNIYEYRGSVLAELFSDGLTCNEVYLMHAECAARLGNLMTALEDINSLLKKRWRNGLFTPIAVSTQQEALAIILKERRKELLFTNTRWMDIKRLNKEGGNIILKRKINQEQYVLLPNDLRYAMAIPEDIISLTGMPQNPR